MKTFNYDIYDNFSGSRSDFVVLMQNREAEDKGLLLRSKTDGEALPCSIRRIDTLQKVGVFLKEHEKKYSDKPGRPEIHFGSEHCYRYELHIRLRKMGLKLEDIARRLVELDAEAIKKYVKDWNNTQQNSQFASEKDLEQYLSSQFTELKRLGRDEGKVLLSEQIRFAVTPYFHVYVSKHQLNRLSANDIDILTSALNFKLKQGISVD